MPRGPTCHVYEQWPPVVREATDEVVLGRLAACRVSVQLVGGVRVAGGSVCVALRGCVDSGWPPPCLLLHRRIEGQPAGSSLQKQWRCRCVGAPARGRVAGGAALHWVCGLTT